MEPEKQKSRTVASFVTISKQVIHRCTTENHLQKYEHLPQETVHIIKPLSNEVIGDRLHVIGETKIFQRV